MKKKVLINGHHTIYAGIVLLGVIITASLLTVLFMRPDTPIIRISAPTKYIETLHIVADKDYDPYSFFDNEGKPSGHDVEFAYLLGEKLKTNIELQLMSWDDAREALLTGKADMLLGASFSLRNKEKYALTLPIQADNYVAFGTVPFQNISQLYGKTLASVSDSGAITTVFEPFGLMEERKKYPSYLDALKATAKGECAYTITTYSVGKRLLSTMKRPTIQAQGPILNSIYKCGAFKKDNIELAAKVNAAIRAMIQDGTLERLKAKWLGNYIQPLTFAQIFRTYIYDILATLLTIFILLLLGITVRSRQLTYQKRLQLQEAMQRDLVTGVYSRNIFMQKIEEIIHSRDTSHNVNALFVLDLSIFHNENQSDFSMQDNLLHTFAQGLSPLFSTMDILGRIQPNTFYILMRDIPSIELVESKAQQICQVCSAVSETCHISVSINIGISLSPLHASSPLALIQIAEKMCRRAELKGKNTYAIYGEEELGSGMI
jgi:diguanylate cyclase (GGDEF)-like protein